MLSLDTVNSLLADLLPLGSVVVPAGVAWLAHRYIKNQAAADRVTTAAGVAYNYIAEAYATSNGKVDFGVVKQAAVQAGAAALAGPLQMPQAAIAGKVDGALGKLLAADPQFSVTQPTTTATTTVINNTSYPSLPLLTAAPAIPPDAQAVTGGALAYCRGKGI